jgi:tetratricopeptide (TPR) repeat protein
MRVRLLGSVGVEVDGCPITLSPQLRALLAILILAPSQPVGHEHIRRRLWPKGGGSSTALRQCITELRRRLPDALPKGNEAGSVKFMIERADVDYFRFLDTVEEAAQKPPAARAHWLRAALAEWRGEPLGGISDTILGQERVQLTRERIKAVVSRLAVLEVLDKRAFAEELQKTHRCWPEDQTLLKLELRRQFARSYQDGEEFYRRWRKKHGRPPREVEREHARLTRGSAARPSEQRPAPHQLPPYRPTLFGRDMQLAALSETLLSNDPATTRGVVVTGLAGVGKTQLAQYWAGGAAGDFPDGTLYADLNGFGSREAPEEPGQILARLLNDLGVEPPAPTLDGMVTAYRTALSSRRALVVLDNARDVHQVRPLLPGGGPCAVIVTSRDRLEQLQVREQLREVKLGPLSRADAVRLLMTDLGTARTDGAGACVDEIAGLCGCLPLALAVVAARVRTRRWEGLAEIASSLRNGRTRLDALGRRTEDLNVRAALRTSADALGTPAQQLLMRLGIHPGPTIGWKAVVAMCGDLQQAMLATDELVAANLLDDPVPDRYALHDLVRLYASESAKLLPPADQADVVDRIIRYLLDNGLACDRVLVPEAQLPFEAVRSPDVIAPTTVEEAMSWLNDEYATVTAAIRRTHELGLDGYTWQLALTMVNYQWRTNRHADAERYLRYAVQAAGRSAGPAVQASVGTALAGSLRGLGRLTDAKEEIAKAIVLAERGSDELGTARGRQCLALLHREMGEPQAATNQYTLALADFRRLGLVVGEAHALAGLADARHDLGDLAAAARFSEAALALFEKTSDYNGQASTIADLGRIHADRGDAVRAIAHFTDAVERYRDLSYRSREARTLLSLADAQLSANAVDDAREALRLARDLFADLGDQSGTADADARLRTFDA